jgi:hypothetical protein
MDAVPDLSTGTPRDHREVMARVTEMMTSVTRTAQPAPSANRSATWAASLPVAVMPAPRPVVITTNVTNRVLASAAPLLNPPNSETTPAMKTTVAAIVHPRPAMAAPTNPEAVTVATIDTRCTARRRAPDRIAIPLAPSAPIAAIMACAK